MDELPKDPSKPVDPDGERMVDEGEADEALPEHLDVPLDEPIADVIDQRRTVVLADDDYASDDPAN